MPYLTKQRTVNGRVEWQCRYCGDWAAVERFARGIRGRRRPICKPCYNAFHEERRHKVDTGEVYVQPFRQLRLAAEREKLST